MDCNQKITKLTVNIKNYSEIILNRYDRAISSLLLEDCDTVLSNYRLANLLPTERKIEINGRYHKADVYSIHLLNVREYEMHDINPLTRPSDKLKPCFKKGNLPVPAL